VVALAVAVRSTVLTLKTRAKNRPSDVFAVPSRRVITVQVFGKLAAEGDPNVVPS
jgi:hypothetical protein